MSSHSRLRYPIAAPDLSGNEIAYVNQCLQSSWISSQGEFVEAFEHAVADFSGCRHGISTCNGTAALHLALVALGVGPGDEVIVPTLTFVATANAVKYCGAEPVFADSDPDTWCVSIDSVARLITPRTKGIIPVHLYGQPCAMDQLRALAERHGLWVLEDAAEALGATYQDRPVGSFGVAATLSFFGNKTIVTGEGGMVVTNDDALASRLRLLRGQGMDPQRRYWHTTLGFNYRMTNVAAAIGLAQMERLPWFLAQRRRLDRFYRSQLQEVSEITWHEPVGESEHSHWMVAALLQKSERRENLFEKMAQNGIETRPFFQPVHHFPMYLNAVSDDGCPVACNLSRRGFCLPTASYLSESDVCCISEVVRSALSHKLPLQIHAA